MKRPAFTLIELLVVSGLLALLAAFTVPTYQIIVSQLQLSNSTEQIADFIRLTEQKTVTEQKIYGITLTSGATTVPQFLYNVSNGAKTTQTTLSLPSYISISSETFTGTDVRFATSGAPNVSGYLVVTDNVRSRSRKIEVRPSGAILVTGGEF